MYCVSSILNGVDHSPINHKGGKNNKIKREQFMENCKKKYGRSDPSKAKIRKRLKGDVILQ